MASTSGWRRVLQRWGIIAPEAASALSQAAEGPVHLVGTLRCEAPIASPIRGRPCAGFFYRASVAGSGRSSTGARMRPLRRATVYATNVGLELDDGTVALSMPPSDEFSAEDHAQLAAADLFGFRAVESTLRDGQRVRVEGRLATGPHGARVQVQSVVPLESPQDAASRAADATD
ncbi:MAG: hypothetical protein PVI30_20890 [Myxococcales bacterium]|jgi:hypothetical protein